MWATKKSTLIVGRVARGGRHTRSLQGRSSHKGGEEGSLERQGNKKERIKEKNLTTKVSEKAQEGEEHWRMELMFGLSLDAKAEKGRGYLF